MQTISAHVLNSARTNSAMLYERAKCGGVDVTLSWSKSVRKSARMFRHTQHDNT